MPGIYYTIFAFSIAIAGVIALIRFNRIDSTYYPFIYLVWIAVVTEVVAYIATLFHYTNAIEYNLYALIEPIFITWQFRKWGLFRRAKSLYLALLFSYVIFWTIECFAYDRIHDTASYFRLYYSFAISLMSINMINSELMKESRNVFKNPVFVICIGFVIYYIYYVFVGVFRVWGLGASWTFQYKLDSVMPFVNLLGNLIFAYAILWMPKKHRFSLQF